MNFDGGTDNPTSEVYVGHILDLDHDSTPLAQTEVVSTLEKVTRFPKQNTTERAEASTAEFAEKGR
jgi:hypothetical protein